VLAKDAVADDKFLGGINFYVKGVEGKPCRRADGGGDQRPAPRLPGRHTKLGVSADLILCFLRHLSEEDAFRHAGAGAAVP
jgi:hypothetical protein